MKPDYSDIQHVLNTKQKELKYYGKNNKIKNKKWTLLKIQTQNKTRLE